MLACRVFGRFSGLGVRDRVCLRTIYVLKIVEKIYRHFRSCRARSCFILISSHRFLCELASLGGWRGGGGGKVVHSLVDSLCWIRIWKMLHTWSDRSKVVSLMRWREGGWVCQNVCLVGDFSDCASVRVVAFVHSSAICVGASYLTSPACSKSRSVVFAALRHGCF